MLRRTVLWYVKTSRTCQGRLLIEKEAEGLLDGLLKEVTR